MLAKSFSSARLDQLAARINQAHVQAETASAKVVEYAVQAGKALIEAKKGLPTGQWLPWLETNVDFGIRTAQQYVRLANAVARMSPAETNRVAHLPLREALRFISGEGRPELHLNGVEEWYTPQDLIERARKVLGAIDLDPASCDQAQKTVKARRYFTVSQDGLTQEWSGRVYMNPPFSRKKIGNFVDKLCDHYKSGDVTEAILLTNSYTDTRWFDLAMEHASAICFPRTRVKFVGPQDKKASPPFGQAFFYFGQNPSMFRQEFSGVGRILRPDFSG